MTRSDDHALIGRVIDGRYTITEHVARGGMASVFQAHDERLDRTVAVKIMHPGLGEEFQERFVREARSAARLNHSHIVSVFDQGSDGDLTYLVMEYVDGPTLRDVMRAEATMPPQRALAITEEMLIGLSAAHTAGIIHRDIKPENVLITRSGRAKVVDFGLARAVSSATTATSHTLIGTISYLAPEIVVNEGSDARSDVYACGAMLYEMLTGLKPHDGDSPIQIAYKHVHQDIAAPSETIESVPDYVDALVARATARDRDRRAADATVMLEHTRRAQAALHDGSDQDPELAAAIAAGAVPEHRQYPVGAGPDSGQMPDTTEHTLRWDPSAPPAGTRRPPAETGGHDFALRQKRRRRRGAVWLAVAILIALLAAAGGWYYGVGRYDSAPNLVGSTWDQAQASAKDAGFKTHLDHRAYSETVPADVVISTDPSAGSKILPGSTIEVIVSKGKERYYLPDDLAGMPLDKARDKIEERHLKVGEVSEKYHEKIAKGNVIKAKDYSPKDALKRDTTVDLVVSKGRKPIEIPEVVGKPLPKAKQDLQAAGFKVTTSKKFDDDADKNTVIAQDPRGGTGYKNDTIALTVSKGPERVKVPDVVGMRKDEATKKLEDAGFKVDAFGPGNFKVRHQSPSEGTKVKPGRKINITFF